MNKMTISPEALVAHFDGEAVILNAATKDYYQLNDTAQAIWRHLEAGRDVDQVVSAIVAEFDVESETARPQVERLIAELTASKLIALSE